MTAIISWSESEIFVNSRKCQCQISVQGLQEVTRSDELPSAIIIHSLNNILLLTVINIFS
jgi:hypothetical protein